MREILFRGKRIVNGDWTFGGFHSRFGRAFIIGCSKSLMIDGVEALPETVGQYTGLTDKNGKRIFEGDIVKTHYANTPKPDFIEQVVFLNGRFCSLYEFGKSKMWSRLPDKDFKPISDYSVYMEWCEVIGNIYDNPELIAEVEG